MNWGTICAFQTFQQKIIWQLKVTNITFYLTGRRQKTVKAENGKLHFIKLGRS